MPDKTNIIGLSILIEKLAEKILPVTSYI